MAKRMIKMNSITNKNIDDAFKDFIKYCRVKNLSNATTQYYEDCFYKFKEYYQGELKVSVKYNPHRPNPGIMRQYT